MNDAAIEKLIYSGLVILVINLIFHFLKYYARKTQRKFGIRKSRYFATRRLLNAAALVLSVLALVFIWELSLRNIWVSATGILAMIAIAFFAIWSLIGNILAGLIIYFTSPFKLEDEIELSPDEVRGTVLAINTFYTVLIDEDGNYVNIPNSLFFQKYIRVIRKKPGKPDRETSPNPSEQTQK